MDAQETDHIVTIEHNEIPTSATNETETIHVHKFESEIIYPTCTDIGYVLYECSCGDSYVSEYIAKLEHSYAKKVVAPTYDSEGHTLFNCTECSDSYKDNFTDPLVRETEPPKEDPAKPQKPTNPPKPDNPIKPTDPPATEPPKTESEETGGGYGGNSGAVGNPEVEDHGFCPKCGRRVWTTWYTTGCFTFLRDTVCECGVLVHAMECHHH